MSYREFTCIVCGAKDIDRSRTGTKKFCSGTCAHHYYRRTHGIGTEFKSPSCIYNNWVICCNRSCGSCGWNPEVETKRKQALAYG